MPTDGEGREGLHDVLLVDISGKVLVPNSILLLRSWIEGIHGKSIRRGGQCGWGKQVGCGKWRRRVGRPRRHLAQCDASKLSREGARRKAIRRGQALSVDGPGSREVDTLWCINVGGGRQRRRNDRGPTASRRLG